MWGIAHSHHLSFAYGWLEFALHYSNGLVFEVGDLPTHLAHLSQLHIYS